MKPHHLILSITLAALALLCGKELRAKCPIGVNYCTPSDKTGGECPDCNVTTEGFQPGQCINGGTLDCDGVCRSHYSQQKNLQVNFKRRFVNGKCDGCDMVSTVFTTILLNCPASDGICTDKTDCE